MLYIALGLLLWVGLNLLSWYLYMIYSSDEFYMKRNTFPYFLWIGVVLGTVEFCREVWIRVAALSFWDGKRERWLAFQERLHSRKRNKV